MIRRLVDRLFYGRNSYTRSMNRWGRARKALAYLYDHHHRKA